MFPQCLVYYFLDFPMLPTPGPNAYALALFFFIRTPMQCSFLLPYPDPTFCVNSPTLDKL